MTKRINQQLKRDIMHKIWLLFWLWLNTNQNHLILS